jgi:hypothetical protein
MNDKQKIVLFLFALVCNFTFLATAQSAPCDCSNELKKDSIFQNKAKLKITEKESTTYQLTNPASR